MSLVVVVQFLRKFFVHVSASTFKGGFFLELQCRYPSLNTDLTLEQILRTKLTRASVVTIVRRCRIG